MGDLKPLGSERLNGDEKLKRILELTYYNQKNKNQSNVKPELVKESKSGGVYGIVKEKDGYYVKRGLNEQSLDYIGGMFMKNKNKFSSYAEALKRLELLKGQEELQEATKYVLKTKPSQEEAPMPEPSVDAAAAPSPEAEPTAPSPEEGGEPPLPMPGEESPAEPSAEEQPSGEEPSGESKPSDYMAEVQKFAGKLGQELRDQKEKMESDDIKYVLNMVISAVDLDKLDLEDLEEISKKFDREEESEVPSENPSDEEVPAEEPSDEEVPSEVPAEEEGELEEYDSMSALESFIDTPIENDEIDLSKYADLGKGDMGEEVVELDLDEIKNEINKSVGETLSKYFK